MLNVGKGRQGSEGEQEGGKGKLRQEGERKGNMEGEYRRRREW